MKFLNFLFIFSLFVSSNLFAEGKLSVNISIESEGHLLSSAQVKAVSDKDTVMLRKATNGKYTLNLVFGLYYRVEISKKGYLTKKITVDTRFPSTLRDKSYEVDISIRMFKLFPEINYDEYKTNAINIKFIGNSSGGYFSYVIKSFQTQQKLDNSLDAKIQKLLGGRVVVKEEKIATLSPEQIKLFKEKYQSLAQKEASEVLAEAYKNANEIRVRARKRSELEHDQIISAAKERAKSVNTSNLSYISSKESEKLIAENKSTKTYNSLPNKKEIEEKEKKYNELLNKSNKSLSDSIEMHIADISLQKDKVGRARYILELMKLRAKTHKDSVLIQQRESEILLAEKEISETEKALIYAKNKIKLQESEIENQQMIMLLGLLITLFGFIFTFVLYRNYKQKNKMNKVLGQKNKEITDSIEYAKKIQTVILPEEIEMQSVLSDMMVFFQPKDIVSGDFYWFKKQEERFYFSVVDCTGHGVPGAFVSIIGFDGIERAINEYQLVQPAEILDKLNEIVTNILSKSESKNVKDGMDLSFCSFSYTNFILEFAGAHNPIYIISENSEKLIDHEDYLEPKLTENGLSLFEIRADRQAIGKSEKPKNFTNRTIKLAKGDRVFLFSDGFPDQFGGENKDKFKYKNFKKLLLKIQTTELNNQRDLLSKSLSDWKGTYEQIDDICIMGVEI